MRTHADGSTATMRNTFAASPLHADSRPFRTSLTSEARFAAGPKMPELQELIAGSSVRDQPAFLAVSFIKAFTVPF